MRDGPLRKCPKCGKVGLRRLVSGGAGLIFKGTGFYITDYKSKKGAGGEGGDVAKPAEAKTGDSKSASGKDSGSPSPSSSGAAPTGGAVAEK